MQLISQTFGGVVEKADKKEFGKTLCMKDKNSKLVANMKSETTVYNIISNVYIKINIFK